MDVAVIRVLLAIALSSVLVLGCNDGSSTPEDLNASDPGVISPSGPSFVRRCEGVIQGRNQMFLGNPTDLNFGKLSFRGLRGLSDRREAEVFKASHELAAEWRAFKALVTIQGGAGAKVSIPTGSQGNFLLLYDPAHYKGRGQRKLAHVESDGQAAVRFGECEKRSPEGESQFIGAVLARRPGCYQVRVHVDGTPKFLGRTVNVAMGANGC